MSPPSDSLPDDPLRARVRAIARLLPHAERLAQAHLAQHTRHRCPREAPAACLPCACLALLTEPASPAEGPLYSGFTDSRPD